MWRRFNPSSIASRADRARGAVLGACLIGLATGGGLGATGCGRSEGAPAQAAPEIVEPAAIAVSPEAPGLVYRYVDAGSGKVVTATSIEAIPAGSRAQVVVFDPSAPTPPGWEHVVDLSASTSASTVPTRGFVLQPARPASTVVADRGSSSTARRKRVGSHEVVMFSTQGCGYCRKARKWFEGQKIPYSEYDVERDPKAPERLSRLAQAAGVGREQLGGVPVIFVDGQPVLGWDVGKVKSLLGR